MLTTDPDFKKAIYDSLCACLAIDPSSAEAARLICEAYNDPENPPRPPRTTNRIYWSVTPDPGIAEAYPAYNVRDAGQGSHRPAAQEVLSCTLLVVCYGSACEEYAGKIRSFLYLDGKDCPRAILRKAGIYPVPRPPRPVFLPEEDGSLWRRRTDISIPLRVLDDQISPLRRNSISVTPAVIIYKTT